MKAILYALGQQSYVELPDFEEKMSCDQYIQKQGYVVGSWFENEEFQISVGERQTVPRFMISLSTAFYTHFFLAESVLDYAELMGKFSSVTPFKMPERQPEWAR